MRRRWQAKLRSVFALGSRHFSTFPDEANTFLPFPKAGISLLKKRNVLSRPVHIFARPLGLYLFFVASIGRPRQTTQPFYSLHLLMGFPTFPTVRHTFLLSVEAVVFCNVKWKVGQRATVYNILSPSLPLMSVCLFTTVPSSGECHCFLSSLMVRWSINVVFN